MKTELKQYAEAYASEVLSYRDLSESEFIKRYIDKNYDELYGNDIDHISEYFGCLEIEHYLGSDFHYFEICLGCG